MKKRKLKKTRHHELKPAELRQLKTAAVKARGKAYAPYSGFKVGAALLTADRKVFSGCNVENASYGGTICAERTSILKAVSEGAATPLRAFHIVSSGPVAWPPCGLCLQMMSEFCLPSTVVTISSKKGEEKMFQFQDLLPESFHPRYLQKKKE